MSNFLNKLMMAALVTIVMSEGSKAEPASIRYPLTTPTISVALGDTSRDYVEIDNNGNAQSLDSEAKHSYNEQAGVHEFRFKVPGSQDWHLATWTPASQLTAFVEVTVSYEPESGKLRYVYSVVNDQSSRHPIGMFGIRVMSDGDVYSSGPEHIVMKSDLDETMGRVISWAIEARIESSNGLPVGGAATDIEILSTNFPAPLPCWVIASVEPPGSDVELPPSVHQAITSHLGMFNDSARGLTVGPSSLEPSLATLRGYVPICISQGWLKHGKTSNRIDLLLKLAEQELMKGSTEAAYENLLQGFNKMVEEKLDGTTPESDALFVTNVRLLLERNRGR